MSCFVRGDILENKWLLMKVVFRVAVLAEVEIRAGLAAVLHSRYRFYLAAVALGLLAHLFFRFCYYVHLVQGT